MRIDIWGLLLSFRVLYHAEFNSCVHITIHCIKFPRIRLKLCKFLFTFPKFAQNWQFCATFVQFPRIRPKLAVCANFCSISRNSPKTGSFVQISVQFLGIHPTGSFVQSYRRRLAGSRSNRQRLLRETLGLTVTRLFIICWGKYSKSEQNKQVVAGCQFSLSTKFLNLFKGLPLVHLCLPVCQTNISIFKSAEICSPFYVSTMVVQICEGERENFLPLYSFSHITSSVLNRISQTFLKKEK